MGIINLIFLIFCTWERKASRKLKLQHQESADAKPRRHQKNANLSSSTTGLGLQTPRPTTPSSFLGVSSFCLRLIFKEIQFTHIEKDRKRPLVWSLVSPLLHPHPHLHTLYYNSIHISNPPPHGEVTVKLRPAIKPMQRGWESLSIGLTVTAHVESVWYS